MKQVLDLAGGFEDPIFRKTINDNIVVLRLDDNQYYGKEFNISYEDSDKFELQVNDKIFVYFQTHIIFFHLLIFSKYLK